MKDDNAVRLRANRVWLSEASCDLDAFRRIVERSVNRADYPFASDVISNVLVYDGLEARSAAASPESRKDIMAEWVEFCAMPNSAVPRAVDSVLICESGIPPFRLAKTMMRERQCSGRRRWTMRPISSGCDHPVTLRRRKPESP